MAAGPPPVPERRLASLPAYATVGIVIGTLLGAIPLQAQPPRGDGGYLERLRREVAALENEVDGKLTSYRINGTDLRFEVSPKPLAAFLDTVGHEKRTVRYRNETSGGHIFRGDEVTVEDTLITRWRCRPRLEIDGAGALQGKVSVDEFHVQDDRAPVTLSATVAGLDLQSDLEVNVACRKLVCRSCGWPPRCCWTEVSTVSYGRDFGADAMLVAFTRPFRLGLGPKPNHEKEKLWFYGDFTIGSVVAGTWRIVPPRPDAIPGDWWRQLTFPLQHPFLLPLPNMRLPLADVDPIGFDRGSVSVVVAKDTKKTRSYELEGLEIDDAGVRDGLYRVDMEIRNVKWGPWTER